MSSFTLRRNFCVRVPSLLLVLFCILPENRTLHMLSPSESGKNPLEGLQWRWITEGCKIEVPGFDLIAYSGMVNQKTCMDSISQNPNTSIISEIPYCENQESYKGCWSTIMDALNTCVETVKDVAGAIYFGLDNELLCDEAWITVVSNMRSNIEENPCQRDFSNINCEMDKQSSMDAKNLCLRFRSNYPCDLDSAHPNCTRQPDTGLYGEVYEKARHKLNCQSSIESNSGDIISGFLFMYIITMLLPTNINIALKS